ncbi:MAG: carboxylesterase family protein, partial [Lachnospiraceae bacterium]|nr:carboxylesterase family protein [Lachnospiraceae bacterium]
MDEVIKETPLGRIKGTTIDGFPCYRGIEYATCKRFEYPVQVTGWNGEYDATKRELDSIQYGTYIEESASEDNFYGREFRPNGGEFLYNEDKLQLSIITPKEAKNCPVLVFIHGGGFETGTIGELPYGSSTEYAKRGIILVSVGYRLNVFSLIDAKNFGLYDQVEAVKWIKNNIEAFGGDPERIVLMGQSAGAMSITDLLSTDLLKGLVSGAVMMSGAGAMPEIVGP